MTQINTTLGIIDQICSGKFGRPNLDLHTRLLALRSAICVALRDGLDFDVCVLEGAVYDELHRWGILAGQDLPASACHRDALVSRSAAGRLATLKFSVEALVEHNLEVNHEFLCDEIPLVEAIQIDADDLPVVFGTMIVEE